MFLCEYGDIQHHCSRSVCICIIDCIIRIYHLYTHDTLQCRREKRARSYTVHTQTHRHYIHIHLSIQTFEVNLPCNRHHLLSMARGVGPENFYELKYAYGKSTFIFCSIFSRFCAFFFVFFYLFCYFWYYLGVANNENIFGTGLSFWRNRKKFSLQICHHLKSTQNIFKLLSLFICVCVHTIDIIRQAILQQVFCVHVRIVCVCVVLPIINRAACTFVVRFYFPHFFFIAALLSYLFGALQIYTSVKFTSY